MGINLLPTADAAGAVTGIGFIVVLILALMGMFALARRSSKRTKVELAERGDTADVENGDLDQDEEDVDPNVGGMGLALAAAILAVVSIFLPALESSSFSHIEKNTLIQSGTGYLGLS